MSEWREGPLARAVATQVLKNRCLLMVPRCNWTGHECDVLGITMDLRLIDIEIKVSRADFKADAKKEKWWMRPNNWRFTDASGGWARDGPPAPDQRQAWPQKVWKHYFVMPREIWKTELVEHLPSPACGVILVRKLQAGGTFLEASVERRAAPNKHADRLTSEQVMDVARLQNMRMWEALKQRDEEREKKE